MAEINLFRMEKNETSGAWAPEKAQRKTLSHSLHHPDHVVSVVQEFVEKKSNVFQIEPEVMARNR